MATSEHPGNEPHVTRADIVRSFQAVGLQTGDTVLVHSSLKAFGHVEGGADTVIDALLEAVGGTGTVVMPTFTWESFHARTEGVFDVRHTPSEVGRITEVFRLRPGVVRSSHLCHSVAAIGPAAAAVTRTTPSAYGPGSTFDALIQLNAWNLFIGVSCTSCTALHAAEEQMRVPYREFRDYHNCTVIEADGTQVPSVAVEYLRRPDVWNDLGKMDAVLAARGVVRTATVGKATLSNVRIREVVEITTRCLAADPYFLLAAECRPDRR